MTTPTESDAALDKLLTSVGAINVNGWSQAVAAVVSALRATEARIATLEASAPARGTWRDGGDFWTCRCSPSPEFGTNRDASMMDSDWLFCADCGTYAPLPRETPAPVAKWCTRAEAFWTCNCDGARTHREDVPECTECGCDRPPCTIAPEYGDGTRAKVGRWEGADMWRCACDDREQEIASNHRASSRCGTCKNTRPPAPTPAPAAPVTGAVGDVVARARRSSACDSYDPTPNEDGNEPHCYSCGQPQREHNAAAADVGALVKRMRATSEAFALCNREWRERLGDVLTNDGRLITAAFSEELLAAHIATTCPANVIAVCDLALDDEGCEWKLRALASESSQANVIESRDALAASLNEILANERLRCGACGGIQSERNPDGSGWCTECRKLDDKLHVERDAAISSLATARESSRLCGEAAHRLASDLATTQRELDTALAELATAQRDRDTAIAELAAVKLSPRASESLAIDNAVLRERIAAWQSERAASIQDGTPITAETEIAALSERLRVILEVRELRAKRIRELEAEVAALRGVKPVVEPSDPASYSRMDGMPVSKT